MPLYSGRTRFVDNIGDSRLTDFADGLETGVSVGFLIHKLVKEEETETDVTYRATDWEPFEISDAYIPADVGCNYIREMTGANAVAFQPMPAVECQPGKPESPAVPETRSADISPAPPTAEPQPLIEVRTVKTMEKDQEIAALGQLLGETEMARDFIAGGKNPRRVQGRRPREAPSEHGPGTDRRETDRRPVPQGSPALLDRPRHSGGRQPT